jgi:predicted ATPase/DNA-binding CsgD family transcriptional regulator/tetratricopeptide (TPR) repeat protein
MKNGFFSNDEVYANNLTWREQEILHLLVERRTNREIADQLHLAESTVKDYVSKILSKLYVKNRREAVEKAKDLGLLDRNRHPKVKPLINLPAEPTRFVGRNDELAEIQRQLGETRLLTLIGPGGIGKTRLALKAAEGAVGDFKDGCTFVALAPIRSAERLIQTIAEGVKFPLATHEDPQRQLLRFLENRQLLLVMDNFEHLLDGVDIINEILEAAPAVKILATSRARLNLQSETILNVGGMKFPDQSDLIDPMNYDAIILFVQSASKVRPGFDPPPDEQGKIITICQIVGGMPLAIELAAAWLNILNVDEIVDELEKGLDILATELRDAPQRHRSIRTVFDHSWSLLEQKEQEIFLRLSVFRGGFTRQAAQQVAGASLPILVGLVNKSFLSHEPDSGRLEVHELLRQYAQEQLEEWPEASVTTQDAHASYYAAFMEERWADLKGHRQMLALAEVEADIENVRAAWRFELECRNGPQIWMFIKGLWHVYWIRWWNHAGMELFAEAVLFLKGEEDEDAVASRALAMAFQGYFMAWLDLADQGYKLAKESVVILEQLNHPEALLLAYDCLGVNAYMLNRYKEEIIASNKMLGIATEMDDKWLLAFALFAVSMGTLLVEDYGEAKRLAESNLKINEEIGDVIGSTLPLIVLGHASLALGEYQGARGYYLQCLKLSEQVGFHYAIQTASKYLGKVALSLGNIGEAEYYLHQSLTITKEIGFVRDIINLLYEHARLQAAHNDTEGAAELLAFVIQHPASQESRMFEGRIRDSAQDLLAKLEDQLPQDAFSTALERGQELELEEIVAGLLEVGLRQ